jgi:ribosome-associated protein
MTHIYQPGGTLKDKMIFIGHQLQEKKASDVEALDVSSYSSAFEGIILASSQGRRHSRALADTLLEQVKKNKIEYLGMEGYQEGEWVLLDLNDVIVHIFTPETRLFYNFEGFWARAETVNIQSPEKDHG